MDEFENVQKLSWPLSKIFKGLLFGRKIYLRLDIYKDILGKKPSPESIGILIHEQTHLKNLYKRNWLIQGLKYWLIPSERYKEELVANKKQFEFLKKKGASFDFKRRAKVLSGWQYLFCVSYKKALSDLEELWKSC